MNNSDLEALFRTLEQAGYMPVPVTETIQVCDVLVDRLHRAIRRGDRVTYLSPTTFDTLAALAQAYPRGLNTPALCYATYKSFSPRLVNCLLQHVLLIRKALGHYSIITLNARSRYTIYRFNPEGVRFV